MTEVDVYVAGTSAYECQKPVMQAVIEGYIAGSKNQFPQFDGNGPKFAWFYGYWEFFKKTENIYAAGLPPFEKNYEPIMRATLEGYIAASKDEFPPHNPYAICGMYAGEEDDNLPGGAWFYGYWEFFKRRGREKQKTEEDRTGDNQGAEGIHQGAGERGTP